MNRMQAYRVHRHRVVFSAPPLPVWLDDPASDTDTDTDTDTGSGLRARLGRAVRHRPFSPLGVTVVRPVGDAMAAVQVIRIN